MQVLTKWSSQLLRSVAANIFLLLRIKLRCRHTTKIRKGHSHSLLLEHFEQRLALTSFAFTADLDGLEPLEQVTIDAGTMIVRTATVTVAQYSVGNGNNLQIADLDGQPGNEVLVYFIGTVLGEIQQNDPHVITHRTRTVSQYFVGSNNNVRIEELDGQPGKEVLFFTLQTVITVQSPNRPSVITQRNGTVNQYNAGSGNNVQITDLDGQPGDEVLFYFIRTVFGEIQQNDPHVITHRTRSLSQYFVGSANNVRIEELDGQPGKEVIFFTLQTVITVQSPNRPSVITQRTGTVNQYNAGSGNNVQITDLDGQPGDEVLFYFIGTVFGEIQSNAPHVITHRTLMVREYIVGANNNVQIAELDGQPGKEVLFFKLQTIFGIRQPVDPVVVTHRDGSVKRYAIGAGSGVEILELDGLPGLEILITRAGAERIVIFQRDCTVQQFTAYVVSSTQDAGNGSLRQAILDANESNLTTNFIVFDLPSGETQIKPLSPLPTVRRATIIVGSNGEGLPGVELNGQNAGDNANGFTIAGNNVLIRGFVINRFRGSGIRIQGGSNSWLAGNYIGTDSLGNSNLGNGATGVTIAGVALNNRVGTNGDGQNDLVERNIISGNGQWGVLIDGANATKNSVAGNFIGTNAPGTAAIGNGWWGVAVTGPDNLIGGSSVAGTGNLVSGNFQGGITVLNSTAVGNRIQGNYVGTNADGNGALGNAFSGILVADWGVAGEGPSNTLVGGSEVGLGNVVSANGNQGVWIGGSTTTGTVVAGNQIGTNAAGTGGLGNAFSGLLVNAGARQTLVGTNADGIGDVFERNVVSGNRGAGIDFSAAGPGSVVAGNYVGTNLNGTAAIGNSQDGVRIRAGSVGSRIGTNGDGINDAAERNLISGNGGDGVQIRDVGTNNNAVAGNYVGTDVTGTLDLGNGLSGIAVFAGPTNTRIGTDNSNDAFNTSERNIVGFNGAGVFVADANTVGTIVAGNYLGVAPNGNAAIPNNDGVYLYAAVSTEISNNVLSGNDGSGLYLRGAVFAGGVGGTGTVLTGNFIGTNATGTAVLANRGWGMLLDAGIKGTRIGSNGDGIDDEAERNVISGNGRDGIAIGVRESDDTIIRGNYIGTDVSGTLDFGNRGSGVLLAEWFYSPTSEGAPKRAVIEANLISGNDSTGITITGNGSDSHRISGNRIGTSATGLAGLPNGTGILVTSGAKDNIIGTNGDGVNDSAELNLISGNGDIGVLVQGTGTNGNTIAGNYIGVGVDGVTPVPNLGNSGVYVWQSAKRTRIGTDGNGVGDLAERNVISGNSQEGITIDGVGTDNTIIAGNHIGVSASGLADVGNGFAGIYVVAAPINTRIGTNGDGNGDVSERNILSGNGYSGVAVVSAGANTIIAGNYIGTNTTGNAAIGNNGEGIAVSNTNSVIIGTNGDGQGDASEGNLLSGNGWDGVRFAAGASTNGVVAGNLVGTNASGLNAIPNALAGVAVYAGNTNIRIGTNADGISDANERNIISGNAREGVWIAGATTDGVVVAGNYIGVNINGVLALGNGLVGVNINFGAKNTRVGTNGDGVRDAAERNIISANGNDGILVRDAGTNGTVIAGNYVGTDVSGTIDLGNIFSGVAVWGGPANTRIGTDNSADAFNDSERNVISGNNSYGTYTADAATMNTLIAGNYIGVNATGNAKLQNDGDGIYVYAAVNTKIRTNVVSGNKGIGMYIRGALYAGGVGGTGTEISGNMIGTNASGITIIGNGSRGIQIDAGSKGTLVGSNGDGINDAQERNLISGNGGEGVAIGTRETDDTIVRGNYIGTDATGELDFGNTNSGVVLWEWYYSPTSEGSPKRALVQDNVISGNSGAGIEVSGAGSDSHRISGNKIGTNKTGTIAVANGGSGIQISGGAKGNTIGTNGDDVKDSAEGNVISGNVGRGIRVTGAGTNDNVVAGNLIGLNALGSAAFSSTNFGVQIDGGALRTRVGTDGNGVSDVAERNIISGNATYGVLISGTGTNDSIVAGNYIGTDMTGSSRIANSYAGVAVQSGALNTRIGTDGNNNGFDTNERNVISGNNSINVYLAFGAAGTVVAGNYVGLNAAGTASTGNGFAGVYLWNGVDNTRIGTDGNGLADHLERNVISGNSGDGITINNSSYTVATTTNNVVAGNYIGLNSAGTVAVANAGNGIAIYLGASNTRIGTDGSNDAFNANERNVISGNGGSGISIADSITKGTVIAGNWVGVNASGDAAIPNSGNGVSVLRTAGARIGTNADGIADATERNVVSGNLNSGIQVQGAVQEVFGLVQVDQMIAATIPSRISTGTIAQADLADSTSPSNGNWAFNHPVPGGGGNDYAFVATGTLQVNTAGTFSLAMAGNEGGRLRVNGTTLITDDQQQGFSPAYASITLPVGSHTFEWTGFERIGSAGWELSVAVGAGNTSAVSSANGWRVLGDPTPHAQISLNGLLNVTVYYSTQIIDTATAIAGNFIGTNASGSSAIPNLGNAGILVGNLARNTRIGTNADGLGDTTERNIISGNAQEGIQIEGSANNTIVAGNYVGSDATGALSLGNGSSGLYSGILVWGNATNTRIGGTSAVEGNFLAFNTSSGLSMPDAVPANSSLVRINSFRQNTRVGVDLGATGATPNDSGDIDGVRNAPVITYSRIQGSSLIVEGFARPGTMFDLYETANYANGFGQGQQLLASFLEGSADDLDGSVGSYGPQFDGVNVGSDTTNRFRFVRLLSSLPSGVSDGILLTAVAVGPTSEFGNWRRLSPNDAPTDILLANSSVVENAPADTAVGALSAADPNAGDTFTYAFVSGPGSEHNANFRIDTNGVVRTVASLNFENQSVHSIRIRATDQVGLFFEKVMSITIVNVTELTQPVQIGDGSSQRSIIRQLVLNFDNAINAEPGAFIVQQRRTDAGVVSFHVVATQAVLTSTAAGGTRVTLTFSGNLTNGFGALADGNYQLTVVGAKVKAIDSQLAFDGDGDGVAGGDLVYGAQLADNFFALFGDTNGDGAVGITEFGQFRSAFGKSSTQAGYDAFFDYEGDGIIGVSDFGQFRARFGRSRMPF